MSGRLTRLALAAAILATGVGGAGAEQTLIVLQGLPHGEEALIDIISVDAPGRRQAVVLKNTERLEQGFFFDPLRTFRQNPSLRADLPPGAYTVYVRDMETGEHWPSQTVFVQRGRAGLVVMRRRRVSGTGEGDDGQGGQGGNN
jgi:hypothetical protein